MSLTSDEAIEMVKSVSRIGVREWKLAALREVREMVEQQSQTSYRLADRILELIDAMIKREEER